MKVKRICIYPQEIETITGRSASYARKLYNQIKAHYKKKKHQLLSFREFYEYTGLSPDDLD